MHDEPWLECDLCGAGIRPLTVREQADIIRRPEAYIVLCIPCRKGTIQNIPIR